MPKSLLVKMGLVFLISGAVTATTTVKMEATKEKNVVVMLHFYFRFSCSLLWILDYHFCSTTFRSFLGEHG